MNIKKLLVRDYTKLFPPLYFYKELVFSTWLSYWPMLKGEYVYLYRGKRLATKKDILTDILTLHARDMVMAGLLCVMWPLGQLSEYLDTR